MSTAKLAPGTAPPKHDAFCTRRGIDGACVNLHCPRCGLPVNVMGHHRGGFPCKPTHTGDTAPAGESEET